MRLRSLHKHALLLAATFALAGCGPIMGKKVDFGSDYANLDAPEMQRLAGKTFYITNDDDYANLVALKARLRELHQSPTPTLFLQREAMYGIHQITSHYNEGFKGFLYPWGSAPSNP